MEIGSKFAIYKLSKVEPPEGDAFYKATIFEQVYNSKNPFNKWETAFYDAYIFDLEFELEPADLDSNRVNEKNKYHFDNIANPEKSVFRAIEFKLENHTVWYGRNQQKDDSGRPIWKICFYITKLGDAQKPFRTENGEINFLKRQIEKQKQTISDQKRRNLDKDVEYRKIIRQITAEKSVLEREIKKLEEIIEKQKKFVSDAKNLVKEANKETMVVRRKNTIANKEIEKAQQKIEIEKQKVVEAKQLVVDAKKEIKQVKKMKKKEVIERAQEFAQASDEAEFDFGDL